MSSSLLSAFDLAFKRSPLRNLADLTGHRPANGYYIPINDSSNITQYEPPNSPWVALKALA